MTEKELAVNIYNFLKLNPKKISFPKINKYDANSFFTIQEIYKNIADNVNTTTYNDIYFHDNKIKLSGEEWLKIFLNSEDIIDYHNSVRINFPNLQQRRFKEKISYECFSWFYNNNQRAIIDASMVNLSLDFKKELNQLKKFLDTEDWNNYFFNLQKIMHQEIISFLSWKNKPLNYSDYSKVLLRELKSYFNTDQVEKYISIVKEINLYRNTFAKASSIKISFKNEFLKLNSINKKSIAWSLYFDLLELANGFNLISVRKN